MPDIICSSTDCIYNIFGKCKADGVVVKVREGESGYPVCHTYDIIEKEITDDRDQCSGG